MKNENLKPLCVLRSWMESRGVTVKQTPPNTMVIAGHNASFKFSFDNDTFWVDKAALEAVDLAVVLAELNRVSKELDLGVTFEPRSANIAKRSAFSDYEGKALRLTQFGRTANPPEQIIKKYDPIIKTIAMRLSKTQKYTWILNQLGQTWEDLHSIGRIFFINHYAQYAKQEDGGINTYMLAYSLYQQFARWFQVTESTLDRPDHSAGMAVSLVTGKPWLNADISTAVIGFETEENSNVIRTVVGLVCEPPSLEVQPEPTEPAKEPVAKRKARVRESLEKGLKSMPHDQMVYRLKEVQNNSFVHRDARREAAKWLKRHQSNCSACSAEVNEQLASS